MSADSEGLKSIIQQEKERIRQVEKQARAESQEALRMSQEDKEKQKMFHAKMIQE